jgi:hypothetical protein
MLAIVILSEEKTNVKGCLVAGASWVYHSAILERIASMTEYQAEQIIQLLKDLLRELEELHLEVSKG